MIAVVTTDLRSAVLEAADRPGVVDAVGGLYADVQRAIDQRRPVCIVSGRCCRFEEFGHRLYVTTLELAAFMADLRRAEAEGKADSGKLMSAWDGTGCPFQVAKLCTAHAFRPFGCRIYFCDATSTDWQHEQYEAFHTRLKAMHEAMGVPYFYVEWRAALQALLPVPSPGTPGEG